MQSMAVYNISIVLSDLMGTLAEYIGRKRKGGEHITMSNLETLRQPFDHV